MSKVLSASIALLLTAGAGAALAAPGPNGHNDSGLCTAYFNGQKKGHDKHGSPGPFAALEAAAGDADGDGDEGTPNDVLTFCGGPGAIHGQPGQNGRFTDCFDGEDPANPNDADDNPCNDDA